MCVYVYVCMYVYMYVYVCSVMLPKSVLASTVTRLYRNAATLNEQTYCPCMFCNLCNHSCSPFQGVSFQLTIITLGGHALVRRWRSET
jgi:hypothetical protein